MSSIGINVRMNAELTSRSTVAKSGSISAVRFSSVMNYKRCSNRGDAVVKQSLLEKTLF